jgi:hypothetical protein
MTSQYLTPIPQDQYQPIGLITTVVGFFLLAYFFMYEFTDADIKEHTKSRIDR